MLLKKAAISKRKQFKIIHHLITSALLQKGKVNFLHNLITVCPRTSDPLYIVSYYINGSLLLGHTVPMLAWSDYVRAPRNTL